MGETTHSRKICKRLSEKNEIQKVCIWGRGPICQLIIHEIESNIQILGIIESTPQIKSYQDVDVISKEQIPEETELIILIPEYDVEKISRQLTKAMRKK